jgi:glutathione-independent formaldehyde dehydrogenase
VASSRAIAYVEPGNVEVQIIDYPKLEVQDGPGVQPDNVGRKTPHEAILKIVATNIWRLGPAHGRSCGTTAS